MGFKDGISLDVDSIQSFVRGGEEVKSEETLSDARSIPASGILNHRIFNRTID